MTREIDAKTPMHGLLRFTGVLGLSHIAQSSGCRNDPSQRVLKKVNTPLPSTKGLLVRLVYRFGCQVGPPKTALLGHFGWSYLSEGGHVSDRGPGYPHYMICALSNEPKRGGATRLRPEMVLVGENVGDSLR